MRLSNVANNGSAPQNAAKQSIRERAGRDQAGTVGPFSGIIMSSNGISLGAVTPHRATPLAPSAPPPTFSHPLLLPPLTPTSSRNLSAPLMVFFALTLAKLDPKRNNKRRNGSS